MISKPKVENPSQARIYGKRRLSFDAGVDYTYQLQKNWGVSAGIDLGVVDWNYYIEAPINAFGSKQGAGTFSDNENSSNYFYYGMSFQPVYRFKWGENSFRLSGGPTIRAYNNARLSDITTYTINRDTPWDPSDPKAGPPDFELNLPPASPQLHTDVSLSLCVERRVSDRMNILFGVRKNWGLKPISDGTIFVQMYDQLYHGQFATRSNYIGLDLQLRYSTRKTNVKYSREEPLPSDKHGFRKAVFAEALGNSLLSLNYDIRLTRFRNGGLGVRAGAGLGQLFDDKFTEFNRYIAFPVTINYIFGEKRHGLETGVGITPQIAFGNSGKYPKFYPLGFANVGYRFQPLKDGLLFRATLAPHIEAKGVRPVWFGASVGYSFQ